MTATCGGGHRTGAAGTQALYWIEIDLVKLGPLAGMHVFLPGRGGQFDLPLTFHEKNHSWSLPDRPDGMLLTGTGARLSEHDLKISTRASGRCRCGWRSRS